MIIFKRRTFNHFSIAPENLFRASFACKSKIGNLKSKIDFAPVAQLIKHLTIYMIQKVCTKCKCEKEISEFPFRNKLKETYHSYCLSCGREAVKKHYSVNIQKYVDKARTRRKRVVGEINEMLYEYLTTHPCVDCGESDPVVLEFDHVRGKKAYDISSLGWRLCSWESILKEIAKCEIRCANCHRRKTAKNFNWFKFNKKRTLSSAG